MSKPWPESVDPIRLVDQVVEFRGVYPLASMDRLSQLLRQYDGEVDFRLSFERNHEGLPVVRGGVATRLCLTCQRCLAAMWLIIERDIYLGIVENWTAVDHLPDDIEPLLVDNGVVLVKDIIGDELILALPVVAMHDEEECPARELMARYVANSEEITEERYNPFAVLKPL